MLPPVLEIHLLWHPGDDGKARELADRIAWHFQGGVFASLLAGGVDVQMHSCGWSGPADVPRPIVWPDAPVLPDQPRPAQRVAVVPLVGREFNRALKARGGSLPWRQLVDELARRAGTAQVRVLPISLDRTGMGSDWPRSLGSTQLGGAIDALRPGESVEPAEREARCLLDLVQSLAQWLSGEGERLRVFISHTKRFGQADEAVGQLVTLVRRVLEDGSRIGSFYDAHDLQPGEDWDRALRDHAATSAVLALRTDRYASREWCQREVLTAKRHGMPVVMLEALTQGEERGSFLLDHVPRLPVSRHAYGNWDDASIRRAVAMLADAWLHRALSQQQSVLAASCPNPYAGYHWLEQAPEPSTLARWLGEGGGPLRLLHPDPPMAAPEHEVLAELAQRCGVALLDITTPRLLVARGADLHGVAGATPAGLPLLPPDGLRDRRIGLSASDSEDLPRLGLRPEHLRQALRELARIVLVSGGTLAYGGNLDRDKFSWLLIDELRSYAGPDCGGLELWLSWQEHRRRSCAELDEVRDAMGSYGELYALGEDGRCLDDPCADRQAEAFPPIEDAALKSRGLTHLREHLSADGYARLLIGGKRTGYSGAMPGLLEEVLMSLRARQPVYLAGGFGGITLLIAAQIDPAACQPLLPAGLTPDAPTDQALAEVRVLVGAQGWSALRNGLSDDQNRHLAVTHRPAEVAMLVSLGLGRLPGLSIGTPLD